MGQINGTHFGPKLTNLICCLCGLQSDSHNLKYMGIDALGRLIKINPDIAEEHQLAVIDCLEVRDMSNIDDSPMSVSRCKRMKLRLFYCNHVLVSELNVRNVSSAFIVYGYYFQPLLIHFFVSAV